LPEGNAKLANYAASGVRNTVSGNGIRVYRYRIRLRRTM
jgi:hypothetical protein